MGALNIPGFHTDGCSLFRCDYATLAAHMREAGIVADALIVDAPYSERTHKGHDDGTASANRVADWATRRSERGTPLRSGVKPGQEAARVARAELLGAQRREIEYSAWSADDVSEFVGAFDRQCEWMLSLTDHVLARSWEESMKAHALYTFAPIACVESGSRVRMLGDGPSNWSTQLVVARPSTQEFLSRWHAKRWAHGLAPKGAYVGGAEKKPVPGGKPEWLMRAIVRDYTAPGDLVCDPCAGGGTTLVAALEEGRRAIGCEPDAGRYEIAVKRIREARRPLPRMAVVKSEQLGLGDA